MFEGKKKYGCLYNKLYKNLKFYIEQKEICSCAINYWLLLKKKRFEIKIAVWLEIHVFGIIQITFNNFKNNTLKDPWTEISMPMRCAIWRHTFSYISITPPVRRDILHWWWIKELSLVFTSPFYLISWSLSTSGLLDCWAACWPYCVTSHPVLSGWAW